MKWIGTGAVKLNHNSTVNMIALSVDPIGVLQRLTSISCSEMLYEATSWSTRLLNRDPKSDRAMVAPETALFC